MQATPPPVLCMCCAVCVHQMDEWESACSVSGYSGMPSLEIRPKALSRHGRQYVYQAGNRQVLFSIGKVREAWVAQQLPYCWPCCRGGSGGGGWAALVETAPVGLVHIHTCVGGA